MVNLINAFLNKYNLQLLPMKDNARINLLNMNHSDGFIYFYYNIHKIIIKNLPPN